MTDLETMKEMLTRAGIDFKEDNTDPFFAEKKSDDVPAKIVLAIEAGYPGFYTIMTFGLDGKLLKVEAYE